MVHGGAAATFEPAQVRLRGRLAAPNEPHISSPQPLKLAEPPRTALVFDLSHPEVEQAVRDGSVYIAEHGTFGIWPALEVRPTRGSLRVSQKGGVVTIRKTKGGTRSTADEVGGLNRSPAVDNDTLDVTPFHAAGAMLAAYRIAPNIELVPVSTSLRNRAAQLARVATFVAEHSHAPGRMQEDLRRALVAWFKSSSDQPDYVAWMLVLEAIFATEGQHQAGLRLRPSRAKEGTKHVQSATKIDQIITTYLASVERVTQILESLCRFAVNLPAAFEDPSKKQLHARCHLDR